MMNALHRWLEVLQETIFDLNKKLPLSLQDKIKNKLTTYVKTYEEPETDENGDLISKIKEKANGQLGSNTDPNNPDADADEDAEDL